MRPTGSLWILLALPVWATAAMAAGAEAGLGVTEAPSPGQYKCHEMSRGDRRENRTGVFCGHTWDGLLCWDETPAGTSVTRSCPDRPDLAPNEKVTRYCDELGNWVQTGSSCQPALKDKLEDDQRFLRDAAEEAARTNAGRGSAVKRMILENQRRCLERMKQEPAQRNPGPFCSRNWDGWLCWDDTPAGTYTSQNCPNYFLDFDPTEKATKYCGEDGQWFRHPDTNRTWSNYSLCNENTKAKLKSAFTLFYITIVGHALSIASLLISLAILFYFSMLLCC